MDDFSQHNKSPEDPIKHVVVLMLENHSFDQMLGCFKQIYPEMEGIDPTVAPYSNEDDKKKVYSQKPTTERQMLLDPRHEVEHVAVQIKNKNSGFVQDFAQNFPDSTDEAKQFIMGYYPLDFLPALHALARDFTICDRWHSSLPGPTWPNRFFALSGTSNGKVNMPDDGTHQSDIPGYFQQTQDTIFDRLSEKGIHWKVYFHDIPQTTVFVNQRKPQNAARYFYIDEFYDDARGNEEDFPQFCLIEPSFMGQGENDDHPPHDVMRAERLIADVYNSIRANDALWKSTLLVVFYDEHGGFYDHVADLPAAIPPDMPKNTQPEYTFTQLGVRVPALLISPWVKKRVEKTLFDHTSLLNYLIHKWKLNPLGKRTAAANNIEVAITENTPRNDTIPYIKLTAEQLQPPDPELEEQVLGKLNAHQTALSILAEHLKDEAVKDLPILYSWLTRLLENQSSSGIQVSLAEPDKLAHPTDVKPRDNIVHFLMHSKKQAVLYLAQQLNNENITPAERNHALRTLSIISGRKYHREKDGVKNAKAWLSKHRA